MRSALVMRPPIEEAFVMRSALVMRPPIEEAFVMRSALVMRPSASPPHELAVSLCQHKARAVSVNARVSDNTRRAGVAHHRWVWSLLAVCLLVLAPHTGSSPFRQLVLIALHIIIARRFSFVKSLSLTLVSRRVGDSTIRALTHLAYVGYTPSLTFLSTSGGRLFASQQSLRCTHDTPF
jgi:hypothetical protein